MEHITLFTDILPEEQERMRVCFHAREIIFKNGEMIMEYSSSMKKIGLILYGRAVLYCCDSEGNQDMIDELKKDAVFGEAFLLPTDSQHYYVCAAEETKVMFIDYEHVIKRCEQACAHHSQMVSNLLQLIAVQSRQQTERIYMLSRSSTRKEDFVLSECTFGRKTQQDPYTSDVLHSTGTVSERRQKCYDKRTEKS